MAVGGGKGSLSPAPSRSEDRLARPSEQLGAHVQSRPEQPSWSLFLVATACLNTSHQPAPNQRFHFPLCPAEGLVSPPSATNCINPVKAPSISHCKRNIISQIIREKKTALSSPGRTCVRAKQTPPLPPLRQVLCFVCAFSLRSSFHQSTLTISNIIRSWAYQGLAGVGGSDRNGKEEKGMENGVGLYVVV